MSDSRFIRQPIERRSTLELPDFLTWCGSMARTPDGLCHLFFSLWARDKGHKAWVTDSEIGYAVSADPLGPYEFKCLTLRGSGVAGGWDRDVTHNPTVVYWEGKFYLYYTGNYGNGEYWSHRNNQRVGVAVAENPAGPWLRFSRPLLDVNPNGWDRLLTTNPSVTPLPDGRFLMIYKASDRQGEGPMYGPVRHGVAFAPGPLGPFVRHPEPIFVGTGGNFPGEDPFVFVAGGKLYAILKDMGSFYTSGVRNLVLFESADGIDWRLAAKPVAVPRALRWADGQAEEFDRLERPQLYIENGRPQIFFGAVKPRADREDSYNLHFAVKFED